MTLRRLTLCLLAALCLAVPAAAADAGPAVVLSPQRVQVDGAETAFEAYNIGGENYYKLRDLACALNGTAAQFEVSYDAEEQRVSVVPSQPYTAVGGELEQGGDRSDTAVESAHRVEVGGRPVELPAWNIGGSNYFRLRSLGDTLGFRVDYDAGTNTVLIFSADPVPEDQTAPPDPGAPDDPSAPTEPEPPAESAVRYETVPVLMYHEVNDALTNTLYLSVAYFEAHLNYFAEQGIHPVTLAQLSDHWANGTPLPDKPIVLSFDDGYVSMYTNVFPLLLQYDAVATFFPFSGAVGAEGFLTADMLREMADAGMEIGSHTVHHVELNTVTADTARAELADSRAALEAITGVPVVSLCYPVGRNNAAVRALAEEAGYLAALTTDYGLAAATDPFALRRLRISRGCGAATLAGLLSACGY